jgi:hypothetical protein
MLLLARYRQQVLNGKVFVWVWISASGRYEGFNLKRVKDNTFLISFD